MKHIIVTSFILTCLLSYSAKAQYAPYGNSFWQDLSLINPAQVGYAEQAVVAVGSRQQWNNVPGAPETQWLSMQSSFAKNNAGAGLRLVMDQIGVNKMTAINASYAYRIRGRNGTLALGVNAGYNQMKTDYQLLTLEHQDDTRLQHSDENSQGLNFGAGLLYSNNTFILGLSMPSIMPVKGKDGEAIMGQHIYGYAAKIFGDKDRIVFKPTAMVNYGLGSKMDWEVNGNFLFKNVLWAGVGTRSLDAYQASAGMRLMDSMTLMYYYEWATKPPSGLPLNTHELSFRVDWNLFSFQKKSSTIY